MRGDFERVKAWLAGGSASDPRPINGGDETGWTILMWTARGKSLEHVEFARYLISRGARIDLKARGAGPRSILPVHYYGETMAANDMVSVLIAAGAPVNAETINGPGRTPLFMIRTVSESTIDVVTRWLRAGASLDLSYR